VGPHTVAGTATRYGLDGPGIESLGGDISAPIQTGPGSTHPPVQWVPGPLPERTGEEVWLYHPHISYRGERKSIDIALLPPGPSWTVLEIYLLPRSK